MLKFFIILILFFLIIGWGIDTKNKCTCSQMKIELDCDLNGCFWDEDKCQPFSCTGLSSETCRITPNCFYNSTACIEFTSCSTMPFDSQEKCQNAKQGCYYYSGSTCSDFSCENYSIENCPTAKCHKSENKCTGYSHCYEMEEEACLQQELKCMFTPFDSQCREAYCSDFIPSAGTCLYLQSVSNFINPCINQGGVCVSAENSSLLNSPNLCAYNTKSLYHWSSSDATDGICEACYTDPGPDPVPKQDLMIMGALVLMIIL